MNLDRIAREMVDVAPPVDLEARIRARLDAVRPDRHGTWWSWRVGAAVGAAAALALIIGVQVSRSLPAGSAPADAAAPAGPVVANSPAPQFPGSPIAEVRPSRRSKIPTSRPSRVPASQLSSEELAWMERRMPALEPLDALQVDHLRLDSIQPEPLAITPLTMTPVATEGGGFERRDDR
jgi:hypothetical protein